MVESKTATIGTEEAGRQPSGPRIIGSIARQKLFAFASLILLMVFFSFASPAFMQVENLLGILQSTAVNGVLAIASTFVIITAGIDLSVGTLMTFCAVMAGVFLTYWQLPLWTGVLAAIAHRRDERHALGHLRRQIEAATLHRHARHDAGEQGTGPRGGGRQADLFQRHRKLLDDFARAR